MIALRIKDTRERKCECCKKKIVKGDYIFKHDGSSQYYNVPMWFVHLDCMIKKLKQAKEKIKENELEARQFKVFIGDE